jgi:hypothetical protein
VILKLDFEKAYGKVQWGFMMEVLKRKNFLSKWLMWMKQIIEWARLVLMVYFGALNMFITLLFELDYRTKPPLGTLMI